MFTTRDLLVFALEAAAAVAVTLFVWPWGRRNNRFAVATATTFVAVILWNLVVRRADASGFIREAPGIPVTWQDVGTGAVVLCVTVLTYGLVVEPLEPARKVVGASTLAGVIATVAAVVAGV